MADTKWSQFPSATPDSADEVVGLHAGGNARFPLANLVYAVRNGLGNIFQSKITANGILKGDGQGGVAAATAGADYQAPLTAGTDYATPAQLADKANQAQIAYVETGTTASRNYTAGEYICWNGLTYTANTNIAYGTTLNAGTGGNLTECVDGGLNSVTEVSAENVTFSTNITGYTYANEYHLVKTGNVVVANINMYTASAIAGSGTLLCTVPVAYRPRSIRRIATWLTYGGKDSMHTVSVQSNGQIMTSSGSNTISGWIRIFGIYIL